MTTPPQVLERTFAPFAGVTDTIPLLNVDSKFVAKLSYTDALALIIRGEVEGVGPSSGRINCLRRLPEHLIVRDRPERAAVECRGDSHSVVARTEMGVYWQALYNSAGDAVGHCWAFCHLRGMESAK